MGSSLNSNFPVYLPEDAALFFDSAQFDAYVREAIALNNSRKAAKHDFELVDRSISQTTTSTKDKPEGPVSLEPASEQTIKNQTPDQPFMRALLSEPKAEPHEIINALPENKTWTTNRDVTNISTKSPLVDLFVDLEATLKPSKLIIRLTNAWNEDPLATLKIIFNARSIHIGKASRIVFYRSCGWLYKNHPLTLLNNLRWLVRPLIEKKASKNGAEDFEVVTTESVDAEHDAMQMYDVKHGVSHGYWKDLLNLLALAANDELHADCNPVKVLNVFPGSNESKSAKRSERHRKIIQKLEEDVCYNAFHLSVARLFAEQLLTDVKLLNSSNKRLRKEISLAAKWAPSFKGFHDSHTFIISSIAEILHPKAEVCPEAQDRQSYLKVARLVYQQKTIAPLRKELGVVERQISANSFDGIQYERVPSIAMKQYISLFIKKDEDRFEKYIDRVAQGKSSISGATLFPSTLIHAILDIPYMGSCDDSPQNLIKARIYQIEMKALDGQWNALVQRVRDSGTLSSSIAVCDASGSMFCRRFSDKTMPVDSSIALSLLVAEVTEPPFGGALITFSEEPSVVKVGGRDDKSSLTEKVWKIRQGPMGSNTNFVAVFKDLILPIAVENQVKPEDMVKQVFVFSDMQFDQASAAGKDSYAGSYNYIKKLFKEKGYELPKLIFWNLAGGQHGTASKPVTTDDTGTALVSGYSQGMLKVFLDNGSFDAGKEEVTEKEVEDETDMVEVQNDSMTPLSIMKKAISHKAYDVLKVFD